MPSNKGKKMVIFLLYWMITLYCYTGKLPWSHNDCHVGQREIWLSPRQQERNPKLISGVTSWHLWKLNPPLFSWDPRGNPASLPTKYPWLQATSRAKGDRVADEIMKGSFPRRIRKQAKESRLQMAEFFFCSKSGGFVLPFVVFDLWASTSTNFGG